MDDEHEGDYVDEDEEGEQCPVCGVCNDPGAMETCEHYVGTAWDGQLMWGEGVERFSRLYSELFSVIEEALIDFDHDLVPVLRAQTLAASLKADALAERGVWESGDIFALEACLPIRDGIYRETGGMLSGSGSFLYMERPELLTSFNDFLESVVKIVDQMVLEREEK